MPALFWAIAIVLIVVGCAGIIMPGLPGTVLVFAGMCLAAWADGFARVGLSTVVILGALTVASYLAEVAAASLGVKHVGASRRAVVGASIGTMIGVLFGIPGVIVGPFAGAVIGELSSRSTLAQAGRVGVAAWLGVLVGTVAKVGLTFIMLGIFLIALIVP